MAVTLIDLPLSWVCKPSLIDFGGDQTGTQGAVQQRFTRVGSRWSVAFSSLPNLNAACGMALIASRLAARAAGSTVICAWPQPGVGGAVGFPVVDGAGQAGPTFFVRGLTPSITLAPGRFFSVVVAGRSYLYQLSQTAVVDGTGRTQFTVAPWLRAMAADGAALSFAAPQIEGFIPGASEDWTLERLLWIGLPAFSINEVA